MSDQDARDQDARDQDANDAGSAGDRQDGAGPEGTIPAGEDGVALTSTDEPSHFNPEEDEGAEQ